MSSYSAKTSRLLLFVVGCFFVFTSEAAAICVGSPLNPITDVCMKCMFPARFGGAQWGGGEGSAPGGTESPVCVCRSGASVVMGVTVGFWDTNRLVETVKDPWCFPALGTSLGGSFNALQTGSTTTVLTNESATSSFQHVNYYMFPLWAMLNLFTDMPCVDKTPFDIAYMSVVDPKYSDDILSNILNPEALLFGNPVTQLSCIADSVAAIAGDPIDALFFCHGSWGSPYPLSGNSTQGDSVSMNALTASKTVFQLGREGVLWDTAIDKCASQGVLTPFMVKSHYRLQIARPVRGNTCIPIGRPAALWGAGKNPAMGAGRNAPDNFLWLLSRAKTCCVGYKP